MKILPQKKFLELLPLLNFNVIDLQIKSYSPNKNEERSFQLTTPKLSGSSFKILSELKNIIEEAEHKILDGGKKVIKEVSNISNVEANIKDKAKKVVEKVKDEAKIKDEAKKIEKKIKSIFGLK